MDCCWCDCPTDYGPLRRSYNRFIGAPIVLGHLKLPLPKTLNDKSLVTDAMTQKANWMTGAAGIGGIIGIGLGYWWEMRLQPASLRSTF